MKPISALLILDGFGISDNPAGNAIIKAGTPYITGYERQYPHTQIRASGMAVGLPHGQMGNSEVGHLNIGAGRIVYQELTRISKCIADGSFYENPALVHAMENARDKGTKLHLIGLVSDGGVHSHIEHLFALIGMAQRMGLSQVYIHAFLDGRDVAPDSGIQYIRQLQAKLDHMRYGQVATVIGRYWSMDRDNIWERVQRAYEAMVLGKGLAAGSAAEAVEQSYQRGEMDEFVQPTVIEQSGQPIATISQDDSVIFFNFRPDRARQLTRSLILQDFTGFTREGGYIPVRFVSMTQYDATFTNLEVAYTPQSLENTLGEYLSGLGLTQLRIAETQKYAHVTFFFNGGVEKPNPGEDRILIESSKVATFDLKPEMSAYEVADKAVACIRYGTYDVMVLNFANPDMVGHTGVMEAAELAVRAVDECVGKVVEAILATGGRAIITADHGNAEQMIDYETGGPYTAHTVSNPVPFIVVDPALRGLSLHADGCLADIAPTLLDMMGIEKPPQMEGKSLLIRP